MLLNITIAIIGAFCLLHEDCGPSACIACHENKCTPTSQLNATFTFFNASHPLCLCDDSDTCQPITNTYTRHASKFCKLLVGPSLMDCVDSLGDKCIAKNSSFCNKFGETIECSSNASCPTGWCGSDYKCQETPLRHEAAIDIKELPSLPPPTTAELETSHYAAIGGVAGGLVLLGIILAYYLNKDSNKMYEY